MNLSNIMSNAQTKLTGYLVMTTLILASFAFLFSTPRSAGADEPTHQATAWYDSMHPLGLRISKSTDGIPSSLVFGDNSGHPCFAFKPSSTAKCQKLQENEKNTQTSYMVLNYPTPYYIFVGFGQRFFSLFSEELLYLGGRIASLTINLTVLFIVMRNLQKKSSIAPLILIAIYTPMAIFFSVVVNPSGWEISTGLLYSLLIFNFTVASSMKDKENLKFKIMIASCIFSMSRTLAFLWIPLLITMLFLLTEKKTSKKDFKIISKYSLPGLIMGLSWALTHLPVSSRNKISATPALNEYLTWFKESLNLSVIRATQMVGNLGWLDTPAPKYLAYSILLLWILLVTFLLICGNNNNAFKIIVFLILTLVLLPSMLETAYWNNWPGWWQGRYILPLAMCMIFMISLTDNNIKSINPITFVAICTTCTTIYMIEKNLQRYSVGIGKWQLFWNENLATKLGNFYFVQISVCAIITLMIALVNIQLTKKTNN